MPIYLDRHERDPNTVVTPADVAQAHMADLQVQGKYGVHYITYWFDAERQNIFCLVNAPNKDLAEAVHREAHGLTASRIIEVDPNIIQKFLGSIDEPVPGTPVAESAFRTILFSDIEGSTSLTQRIGDEAAMDLLREHDGILRESIEGAGGTVIKHTGDGMMACFGSVVRATESAVQIQRRLRERNETRGEPAIRVRIGLAAGEPVTEEGDLFGAAVQLAARVCATCNADAILASSTVRDLSIGKGFPWESRGEVELKGFDEPIRVYELMWLDSA